jgi:hypothetical protein
MAVKNPSYMPDNQLNKNPYNINYKGKMGRHVPSCRRNRVSISLLMKTETKY